jgi:hypothetical protein
MSDTTGGSRPGSGSEPEPESSSRPEPAGPPTPATPAVPPGWSTNQPPPAWVPPAGSGTGQPGWSQPDSGQPGGGAPSAGQLGAGQPDAGQLAAGGWSQPGGRQGGQSGWGQPGSGQQGQPGWGQQGWGQQPGWAWGQPVPPPVKPGIIPLRPLGIGEMLDGAISCIRRNPAITLLIGAGVALVTQVLNVLVVYPFLPDESALEADATFGEVMRELGGFLSANLFVAILGWLAGVIATGMLTILVSRQVIGRQSTLGEVWAATRPRLLRLIGLAAIQPIIFGLILLVGIAPGIGLAFASTGAGIALAVVGGIAAAVVVVYLYVGFAVAAPALMLERQPVFRALGRSRHLVQGKWWRVLGITLLAFIITTFVAGIISTPFQLAGGGFTVLTDPNASGNPSLLMLMIGAIGGVLGSMITLPFAAAITVLLYVDLRIRKEALDIELARAAGVELPGAPTTATTRGSVSPPAQPGG